MWLWVAASPLKQTILILISFSTFTRFLFVCMRVCMRTLGSTSPELQRSLRPLHLPGSSTTHEPRSRAGDFRGFACFTKFLLLYGIESTKRKGEGAYFSSSTHLTHKGGGGGGWESRSKKKSLKSINAQAACLLHNSTVNRTDLNPSKGLRNKQGAARSPAPEKCQPLQPGLRDEEKFLLVKCRPT